MAKLGSSEGQKIKTEFTRLRNFGCEVFNFNARQALPKGMNNHPDYFIIVPKYALIYIEVKRSDTKDKFHDEQERIIKNLSWFMGLPYSRVYVTVCTDSKQAKNICDKILKKDLI